MDPTSIFHHSKSMASVCRLCFMERKQLELIFENDSKYLSEWIEKLTSLKLSNVPNAPASLCSECKSTLEAFDSFREMCIANDVVFNDTFCQNHIKTNDFTEVVVKKEPSEDFQMNIAAATYVKSSIKCEKFAEQENIDAAIDIYAAKVQDVQYISTETTDCGENASTITQNTIAEDEIKIEDPVIDNNSTIDCDKQTEENVQVLHSVKDVLSDILKYPCKICNTSTSKLHILTHKQPDLFQCYICSKELTRFNFVSQHIFKWHKDKEYSNDQINNKPSKVDLSPYRDGDFECKVCKRTESKMHNMTHKAKGLFQCYICAKKFNRSVKCVNHINWHLRPNKVTLSCNFCKICMKFKSKIHVTTHKAVGLYVCHLCKNAYKKFWSLTEHMKNVHSEKDTPKTLDAKEVPTSVDVSSSVEVPSSVEVSSIEVASSVEVPPSVKVDVHKGSSVDDKFLKQRYLVTCKICDKNVSKLHMKTHKADKRFMCYICSKMFKRYDYVSKHISQYCKKKKMLTREDNAEDNNQSDILEQPNQHKEEQNEITQEVETEDSNQSQEPMVSKSKISDISEQANEALLSLTAPEIIAVKRGKKTIPRMFECKICHTSVTKLHAESHKAEGFQCPICLSHYVKFDHYSRHIKVHRDQGKYTCKICNRVLVNAVGMARHEKLHKRELPSL
ncbi:zinc finger protein 26 isoform X3 [Aedes aegypti]|uniref:Uncharacterized protein n=1 Tax=Aedes aegypti TaxID=7159 RepID=A0A6I8TUD4_AEDAE|nr:zinc finger protein 26 isoform X3 [Aedes aegypti]